MRPELFSTNIDGHDLALYGENDKPGRAPAVLMVIPGHDYEGGELELELSGEHIQELAEALAPPEPGWRLIATAPKGDMARVLLRYGREVVFGVWTSRSQRDPRCKWWVNGGVYSQRHYDTLEPDGWLPVPSAALDSQGGEGE